MDYEHKYLKYKTKYLKLKSTNQEGGKKGSRKRKSGKSLKISNDMYNGYMMLLSMGSTVDGSSH